MNYIRQVKVKYVDLGIKSSPKRERAHTEFSKEVYSASYIMKYYQQ